MSISPWSFPCYRHAHVWEKRQNGGAQCSRLCFKFSLFQEGRAIMFFSIFPAFRAVKHCKNVFLYTYKYMCKKDKRNVLKKWHRIKLCVSLIHSVLSNKLLQKICKVKKNVTVKQHPTILAIKNKIKPTEFFYTTQFVAHVCEKTEERRLRIGNATWNIDSCDVSGCSCTCFCIILRILPILSRRRLSLCSTQCHALPFLSKKIFIFG